MAAKKTAAAECGRPYKIRFGFVTSRHRGRISQYAILNRHLGPNTDCTYVACGSSLFAEEEEEEQKTRNYPVDIDSDFCRNNILWWSKKKTKSSSNYNGVCCARNDHHPFLAVHAQVKHIHAHSCIATLHIICVYNISWNFSSLIRCYCSTHLGAECVGIIKYIYELQDVVQTINELVWKKTTTRETTNENEK